MPAFITVFAHNEEILGAVSSCQLRDDEVAAFCEIAKEYDKTWLIIRNAFRDDSPALYLYRLSLRTGGEDPRRYQVAAQLFPLFMELFAGGGRTYRGLETCYALESSIKLEGGKVVNTTVYSVVDLE
jgi:hypothetical protein